MFRLLIACLFWIPCVFQATVSPRLCRAADAQTQQETPPNIVVIIADDCTYRDLGCYGGQANTPRMNQLAGEGMQFSRCFQSAPMCSPTRHNLYTGLFPVRSGAYPNHTFVDAGTQSLVQYLKPFGYRIAHSGKSHVSPASVFAWESLPAKNNNPDFKAAKTFVSDCVDADQPFCLLLCSNEPHTPWNLGDPSKYPPGEIELPSYLVDTPETREGMSRYLAEITYFDSQVGEAIDMLDDAGVAENTLLVVLSEQGNSMPFAKWTCYDSGLQSGCLVRWPNQIAAGSQNAAMIEYVDFLPTFISAAGGEPDESLDGKSLLPVFAGQQSHKTHVFGEMTTRGVNAGSDHYGIRSVRDESFKYIWNFSPEVTFQNACTKSPEFRSWVAKSNTGDETAKRLVDRYTHRPEIELYDLRHDPLEETNLAGQPQYADIESKLRARLDAWMADCGDEGPATEMKALERMKRGQKKKGKKKKRNAA